MPDVQNEYRVIEDVESEREVIESVGLGVILDADVEGRDVLKCVDEYRVEDANIQARDVADGYRHGRKTGSGVIRNSDINARAVGRYAGFMEIFESEIAASQDVIDGGHSSEPYQPGGIISNSDIEARDIYEHVREGIIIDSDITARDLMCDVENGVIIDSSVDARDIGSKGDVIIINSETSARNVDATVYEDVPEDLVSNIKDNPDPDHIKELVPDKYKLNNDGKGLVSRRRRQNQPSSETEKPSEYERFGKAANILKAVEEYDSESFYSRIRGKLPGSVGKTEIESQPVESMEDFLHFFDAVQKIPDASVSIQNQWNDSTLEENYDLIIEDLMAENWIYPEHQTEGEDSLDRPPKITAHDTGENILYTGTIQADVDTDREEDEPPRDWISREEPEISITVSVDAENATEIPPVFESERTYNRVVGSEMEAEDSDLESLADKELER